MPYELVYCSSLYWPKQLRFLLSLFLCQAFFYLTDASTLRNRVLYYRKQTWLRLQTRAMQGSSCTPLHWKWNDEVVVVRKFCGSYSDWCPYPQQNDKTTQQFLFSCCFQLDQRVFFFSFVLFTTSSQLNPQQTSNLKSWKNVWITVQNE